MKNDPERKPSESQSSAPDEAPTAQEAALSETSQPNSVTGEEPVPVGDEQADEEKRIAQERELDEKLGNEEA